MKTQTFILLAAVANPLWASVVAGELPRKTVTSMPPETFIQRWDRRIETAQSRAELAGIQSRQWLETKWILWHRLWFGVRETERAVQNGKREATGIVTQTKEAWHDVHTLFKKDSKETL